MTTITFPAQLKPRRCIVYDNDRSCKVEITVPALGVDLEILKRFTEVALTVSVQPGNFTFIASIQPGGIRFDGDKAYGLRLTIPASEVAQAVKFLSYSQQKLTIGMATA